MDNINFSFKKTVSSLCFLLVIAFLIANTIVGVVAEVSRRFYYDNWVKYGMIAVSSLTMTVPFIIFAQKYNIFNDSSKKEKQSFKVNASMIFLGLLIAIAASILTSIVTYVFSSFFNFKFPTFEVEGSKSIFEFVINTITIAIIPALTEEFIFRGVVLNLLNRYNSKAAIVISATLFALYHGNVPQFIFALVLGLYLGFLFVKTKSLKICMLTHFSINFFSVITSSILVYKESNLCIALILLIELLVILIGSLSLVVLKQKKILSIRNLDQSSLINTRKCYVLASSTLGAVVFIFFMIIVFCLLMISGNK